MDSGSRNPLPTTTEGLVIFAAPLRVRLLVTTFSVTVVVARLVPLPAVLFTGISFLTSTMVGPLPPVNEFAASGPRPVWPKPEKAKS
jgi:hypothetical protein